MRFIMVALCLAFVLLNTSIMNTSAQIATIRIDINEPTGELVRPLIGFNSGIAGSDAPNDTFSAETTAMIAELSPLFWKVSNPYHYRIATSFGAQIQFETVGIYFGYNPQPFPWHDWGGYEQAIENAVSTSLRNEAPIFLWDIWNEPAFYYYDNPLLVLEAFTRAYHTIKITDPNAKITGPSLNGWVPQTLERFLDFLVENDMQFAALNWHELSSRPEELVSHVQEMRAMIATRPTLGSPLINIDEYQTEAQHLIPGFNLAWFYYLEQAEVDYAARACWNVQDPKRDMWNDCWRGLNGLFTYDNQTPTAIYWVYRSYAATAGQERWITTSTAPSDTVALASFDSTTEVLTILVGRFQSEQSINQRTRDVELHLTHFPYPTDHATVEIVRIPNSNGQMMPLSALESSTSQPLSDLSIHISDFHDGDVYVITVHTQ